MKKKYRIFLILAGKATPGDNNLIWIRNLYDPLVKAEHDVFLINIDEYLVSNGFKTYLHGRERLSNDLPGIFLKEHTLKPFDIFFSYLNSEQIIPEVFLEIKRHVFTINYSTNYHQFDLFKDIAANVDFNIYISSAAKQSFENIGVKSYWMPLAANPKFYKPSAIKNEEVVFIGSVYGNRPYLFWRLLQYGINLHLYGYGWIDEELKNHTQLNNIGIKKLINSLLIKTTGYEIKINNVFEDQLRSQYGLINHTILSLIRRDYSQRLHGSLSDMEYMQTLGTAGIVVNIQESRFDHDYYNHNVLFGSNLRDYEATLCGAFLCTQYSSEIEDLFEIGKEIICYHNEHDLAEKIQYFTKNQSQMRNIAEAGYYRSLNSHTWEKRFNDFFEFLRI